MKEIEYRDTFAFHDQKLFYKNDYSLLGADPGALYVSKEMNAEWGGYFYIYLTGERRHADGQLTAYRCFRSANLSEWMPVGQAEGGDSLAIEEDAWACRYFWAPEVAFNPKDKKFYMYFSAGAKLPTKETDEYTTNEEDRWSGLYLGIAVSDTPAGPFKMVDSKDCEGGVNANGDVISRFNPPFNFEKKLGIGHTWAAIDISPFFAPDGSLYVYFAKHVDKYHKGICVYGMKMKDMISPDYSTLTKLTQASVLQVKGKAGTVDAELSEETIDEGSVNEGPFMTYHDGRYYLTYSPYGYGSRGYAIMQAVSDSPLGVFTKIPREIGNPSLGINKTNDYMAGTGHHNFAYAGGEIIAVYHAHSDPVYPFNETGGFKGRVVCFDKMHFVYNETLGYDILMGNGPTASVQPIAKVNAKYPNIADQAELVSNAVGGEKYLTDDLFPVQEFDWEKEAKFEGSAVITFTFETVRTIKAVMVYNSARYEHAFKKVDIVYTLEDGEQVVAKDVGINSADVNERKKFMRQGGSATAETQEMQVRAVTVKVTEKLDDSNPVIGIGEIYILGKNN